MGMAHLLHAPPSGVWGLTTALRALRIFMRIEATLRAAAFAYYTFLSLFSAILLCVAVASLFFDRDQATAQILDFFQAYVPIGEQAREYVFRTIAGVVNGRAPAGAMAVVLLAWSSKEFISTLMRGVNFSWGEDPQGWLQLTFKSLLFLLVGVAAVPVGIAFPLLLQAGHDWLMPESRLLPWAYSLGTFAIRFSAMFGALSVLYRLAPNRRTRFREVWLAAVCATLLLVAAQMGFGIYLTHFAKLNAVYGAFGAIMALLVWIYVSGCIFIYGACLCAAHAREPIKRPRKRRRR
jgi:YihY family inner membrane protein